MDYITGDNKHHDGKVRVRERTRVLRYGDAPQEENVYYLHSSAPRPFNVSDRIFAWICLFLGYIFCCSLPIKDYPIIGFGFVLLLFSITSFFLIKHKAVFRPIPVAAAVSAVVLSFALVFTGNTLLWVFAYAYSLVVYCYFLFSASGNRARRGFTDYIAVDFIEALFVAPFFGFTKLFKAMFVGLSKRKRQKIVKSITNSAVALIPISIFFVLLSYDWKAVNEYGNIPEVAALDVIYRVLSIGFAIPIAMYIFGLYSLTLERKRRHSVVKGWLSKMSEEMKIMPAKGLLFVAVTVLSAYVAYVIVKWEEIFAGFTDYLPIDETVSELARAGLLEATAISVINIIVILTMVLLVRRYSIKSNLPFKILTVVYCLYSIFLISVSSMKMLRCIRELGLSRNRIYGLWTMVLLAVVCLIIIVKQFVPRFKALATIMSVAIVLFGALAFSNVDLQVSNHNINGYINGTYDTVDVDSASLLGDDAVPDLVRLYEFLDEKVENNTANEEETKMFYNLYVTLNDRQAQYEENKHNIFAYNVPRARAVKALQQIDLSKETSK